MGRCRLQAPARARKTCPCSLSGHAADGQHRHAASPDYSMRDKAKAELRERNFELAVENAARIGRITFVDALDKYHKKLLGQPLPQLEILDLVYGRFLTAKRKTFEIGKIHIDAPALREASFRFMRPQVFRTFNQCVTFGCPALQSLTITIEATDPKDTLRPRWIADVLKTIPLLRRLALSMDIKSAPFDWTTLFRGKHAHLAHLQSLDLCGTLGANLADLYRCLGSPCPARCILRYEPFFFPDNEETDLVRIENAMVDTAAAFSQVLRHPSHAVLLAKSAVLARNDPPVRGVKNNGEHVHQLTLRLFSAADPHSKDIVELTMYSILASDRPAYEGAGDFFAQALAHSAVRQLIVEAPWPGGWSAAVQPIAVACAAATQLVIYGNVSFPDTAGSLSALDTMFFRPQQRYNSKTKVREEINWEKLVAWLEARSEAGLRLRRLYVRGFDISKVDKREGAKEKDRAMCARVAELVDEFADERKGSAGA